MFPETGAGAIKIAVVAQRILMPKLMSTKTHMAVRLMNKLKMLFGVPSLSSSDNGRLASAGLREGGA